MKRYKVSVLAETPEGDLPKTYDVVAHDEVDAMVLAFAFDGGFGPTSRIDLGDVALARQYCAIEEISEPE